MWVTLIGLGTDLSLCALTLFFPFRVLALTNFRQRAYQREMGLARKEVGGSSDPAPSGESGRSSTSSEPSVPRRFPLAAQPEIMRAAEKDEQYASFVYDACRDAFRHLFGPLSLSLNFRRFNFITSTSDCWHLISWLCEIFASYLTLPSLSLSLSQNWLPLSLL